MSPITKTEYYNTFIAPIGNAIKILIFSILEENRDMIFNIGLQAALNEIRVIQMSLVCSSSTTAGGITEADLKTLHMEIDGAYSTVVLMHHQFNLKKLDEQIDITLTQVMTMFKTALRAMAFIKRDVSDEPASPADLLLALASPAPVSILYV